MSFTDSVVAVPVTNQALVDSGAPTQVVQQDSRTNEETTKTYSVDVAFVAPMGLECATQQVSLAAPAPDIDAPAPSPREASAVASLDRLVIDGGHDLHWSSAKPHAPWLVTPVGETVVLDVRQHADFLPGTEPMAKPVACDDGVASCTVPPAMREHSSPGNAPHRNSKNEESGLATGSPVELHVDIAHSAPVASCDGVCLSNADVVAPLATDPPTERVSETRQKGIV